MAETALATRPSAITQMATRFNVEPGKLLNILKATVIKKKGGAPTDEECAAFVVVANEYDLNPFTKEIHAFESNGIIVPIVGIDGWARIVNRQDRFDGCEFQEDIGKDGKPLSTTCIMFVRDRGHPIKVTEWYDECRRSSIPWNTMPKRMLRHKAFMQAARLAFGLSGIYDEDEARDIVRATPVEADLSKPKAERLAERVAAAKSPALSLPSAVADEPVIDADPHDTGMDESPGVDVPFDRNDVVKAVRNSVFAMFKTSNAATRREAEQVVVGMKSDEWDAAATDAQLQEAVAILPALEQMHKESGRCADIAGFEKRVNEARALCVA